MRAATRTMFFTKHRTIFGECSDFFTFAPSKQQITNVKTQKC